RTPPEPRTRAKRGRESASSGLRGSTSGTGGVATPGSMNAPVREEIQLGPFTLPRTVDPLPPGVVQYFQVEGFEPGTVVEVPQMRQLMAEGVDEARVFEGLATAGRAQTDRDSAFRRGDPIPSAQLGSL